MGRGVGPKHSLPSLSRGLFRKSFMSRLVEIMRDSVLLELKVTRQRLAHFSISERSAERETATAEPEDSKPMYYVHVRHILS